MKNNLSLCYIISTVVISSANTRLVFAIDEHQDQWRIHNSEQ